MKVACLKMNGIASGHPIWSGINQCYEIGLAACRLPQRHLLSCRRTTRVGVGKGRKTGDASDPGGEGSPPARDSLPSNGLIFVGVYLLILIGLFRWGAWRWRHGSFGDRHAKLIPHHNIIEIIYKIVIAGVFTVHLETFFGYISWV